MSKFTKKFISALSAFAIIFSVVTPIAGVNALYENSLEAANKLASLGVIVDQSANPADYRLGDTVTRREIAKVAVKVAATQGVTENTECRGDFADLSADDWGCKYAETLLDNGMVAANANFNPDANITQAESLKMMMNAAGVAKVEDEDDVWANDYVNGAVDAGIAEDFSDYDTAAQRGWIFKVAANALEVVGDEMSEEEDDLLEELLGGLDDDEEEEEGEEGEEGGETVSGDDVLTVSLSPETPEGATVPGWINGLPVASYDLTAGSEDVTVTSITVKRKGLSDKDTLEAVAAFSEEGRASKSKDDSQENNTEAMLTLTNGFVVKAGETRTLTVVADLGKSGSGANDEFAIELMEVVASATADAEGSLVGDTFRIGSVDAPELVLEAGSSVSDVILGDEGADIFKFEVKGAKDEDVLLKSITFKSENGDAEDNLMNFKLYNDGDEVAATAMMVDKYLTFDLGDGLTIGEDKTEKFTVTADVVAGAGDTLEFYVDKSLDVTAESTKYGYGASVDISAVDGDTNETFGEIEIDAGELTLVDVEAPSDKIREDKDDVELGSIKVTNVAGQNLELLEFGVLVDNVDYGTTTLSDLDDIFENFELYNEDSGASYELELDTNDVYGDDDLNITLPQGTTTFVLRTDTKDGITDFDSFNFELKLDTGKLDADGGFYVEETEDDKEVDDITPSSLSWNTIDGSEAGASVANVPLADIEAVRGADDVVALQFEVEATESSDVTIDEATVYIDADGSDATNQEISSVTLYQGSVSEDNLLDRVSGSKLGSGVASFDGFDVVVPADETETFIVTLSFVDGQDAVDGSDYTAELQTLSVEDDEDDDVTVDNGGTELSDTNPLVSNRQITVEQAGEIVTLETNAWSDDNEFEKVVLAGTSEVVVSYDVRSDNESVEVETVTYTYAGPVDLGSAGATATLWLGDTEIATNSNSDIDSSTIVFEDLDLVVTESTEELRLRINTQNVGDGEVGDVGTAMSITNVELSDMKGADSGKDVSDFDANVDGGGSAAAQDFDLVPATVVASLEDDFNTGDPDAEVTFTADSGDNTDSSGDDLDVTLESIEINVSSLSSTGTITVFNGNSDNIGTFNITTTGDQVLDVTDDLINGDTETYRFESTAEASFRILKDGVSYDVDSTSYTTKAESNLELGTYDQND